MISQKETQAALERFAKYVKQQARANVAIKRVKDTGKLQNSIDYELEVGKNSFSLAFMMEDYGTFRDLGVRGKTSSELAPNSPYRFGTGTGQKGGLTKAMLSYVQRNRIQFRDFESGKFMSYKSTAFLIARAVYNRGLRETKFFSKPFEDGFNKLPESVTEAYGLDLENFLKYSLNENN